MEKLNLNPDARLEPAPGRTEFDWAVTAAKAGALALPFVGTGVALFDLITTPMRNKRVSDWLEELRIRFNELSQKVAGLTPERLAQDEAFQSAFAHATQAAMRTHQQEKLDALRNAVLNVAIGNAPSDDLQLVFLNFVDSFTPTHLKILTLFDSKDLSGRNNFAKQQDITDHAIVDLRDRGLLRDTRAYLSQNRDSGDPLINLGWEVTNLGKQFLAFIKSPLNA
jgi:hypothetical protein